VRILRQNIFVCSVAEQTNETLQELHLLKHGIRDFGATRLAEELRHNFTLTYLALSWYFAMLFISHTHMHTCTHAISSVVINIVNNFLYAYLIYTNFYIVF